MPLCLTGIMRLGKDAMLRLEKTANFRRQKNKLSKSHRDQYNVYIGKADEYACI
jgi:hypothetical protein